MIHAMIDIETLGVGSKAPLFEIGAVVFDFEKGERSSRFLRVDIMDVMLKTGFPAQEGTLKWWRKQEYDPTVGESSRLRLEDSLVRLKEFFELWAVEKVWANSPSFDLVILENHYQAVEKEKPWRYSQELDFRTIFWLAKSRGFSSGDVPVTHNALDDCRRQVTMLRKMIDHVGVK